MSQLSADPDGRRNWIVDGIAEFIDPNMAKLVATQDR